MDPFSAQTAQFLEWFRLIPGSSFHPSLSIEDLRSRHAGRGIIATSPIPPGTELFKIPREAVITVENSSLVSNHPTFFDDAETELRSYGDGNRTSQSIDESDELNSETLDDELDPWLRLIITLIYEHFQCSKSRWTQYLDILPSTFDTLMFWTDAELGELQASDVRQKIGKEDADALFRTKLIPIFRKFQSVFNNSNNGDGELPSDDELVAMAHRMGSTVMAYAFDLEKDEEEDEQDGWIEDHEGQMLGMIPMADMLNADAEFNAHLNHGTEALTMTSLREIEKDEEILNYYGPLPNADLLRRYGYTSVKHRVHDVVDLPWSLITAAVEKLTGISAGSNQEISLASGDTADFEDTFIIEWDSVSPDDTGRILTGHNREFTGFPEELRSQYRASYRSLDSTIYWEALRIAVSERQSQYPDKAGEDDKKLLETAQGRLKMATEVRLGEKQLLAAALEYTETRIRAAQTASSEPRMKRQKTSR